MIEKQKKVCTVLNYNEHLLIIALAVTVCISTFVFASLLGIPIGVTSTVTGWKFVQ